MAITIPSLKSGDTLFITLGDNAHGKKLQFRFIACWKSIIACFIDNFTQKNGTRMQQSYRRDWRSCRGDESTLFSLFFLAIIRAASIYQNMSHFFHRLYTEGINGYHAKMCLSAHATIRCWPCFLSRFFFMFYDS